jgi:acyl carrier protein
VLFPSDTSGTWTVPPHFIDGVVSLSGFILNGGTHFDNTNNFFITPSWKSMRFAKPLTPGGRYLAYVRMVPADNHSFVGDVYILEGPEIVGVVEAILFRQWPRVMLNRFFRPPDAPAKLAVKTPPKVKSLPRPVPAFTPPSPTQSSDDLASSPVIVSPPTGQDVQTGASTSLDQNADLSGGSEITSRALTLVAEELAVDVGLLTDEAQIADLGLDSLMSLVMSQRLREELGIEIRDAFFLEISNIGDLKKLLH